MASLITPDTLTDQQSLHSIPIRSTATSGLSEATGPKLGLEHLCIYLSAFANGTTYAVGSPLQSAAIVPSSATTAAAYWDPDDATGTVGLVASGASTGWLHIWRYPGLTSAGSTTATAGTPYTALNGNPATALPIRTTAGQGLPEAICSRKNGLVHRLFSGTVAVTTDWFAVGQPVISAAFVPTAAETTSTEWTPGLATGLVVVNTTGATAGYLHVWTAH